MLFNYVKSSFDSALAKAMTKKDKSPNTFPTMSKKDLSKLKKVFVEKQKVEKAEILFRLNTAESKLSSLPLTEKVEKALALIQNIKSQI